MKWNLLQEEIRLMTSLVDRTNWRNAGWGTRNLSQLLLMLHNYRPSMQRENMFNHNSQGRVAYVHARLAGNKRTAQTAHFRAVLELAEVAAPWLYLGYHLSWL